VLADAEVLVA
jgi:glycyl-tRNA synthetase